MKNECKGCAEAGRCRAAFGRYWKERSGGGVGCERRIGEGVAAWDAAYAAAKERQMKRIGTDTKVENKDGNKRRRRLPYQKEMI